MKNLLFALSLFCLPAWADWTAHFDARTGIIGLQAQIIGTGHQALIGDSNSEAFWWSQIAACYVSNAGMGGATIHDIAGRIDAIATLTGPSIAHVMVGTNDGAPTAQMRADMVQIVTTLKAHGALVVVWPIPSSVSGNKDAINAMWLDVSNYQGVYYDWWWTSALGPDGVHLSAASQISRYYRIDVWRQYILAQTGVNGC